MSGNTSFEAFSVRIGATVRPGRVIKKIYRTTNIFPLFGGKPHWTDSIQKLHGGCAKFQIEIFMGYDFIAYVIPHIFWRGMHPSHPPRIYANGNSTKCPKYIGTGFDDWIIFNSRKTALDHYRTGVIKNDIILVFEWRIEERCIFPVAKKIVTIYVDIIGLINRYGPLAKIHKLRSHEPPIQLN